MDSRTAESIAKLKDYHNHITTKIVVYSDLLYRVHSKMRILVSTAIV